MNYTEKGYIFQDAFSVYIIIKYINEILCGKSINTEIVLDKKMTENDKFDDVKLINDRSVFGIQIKYRESKELIEKSDFINYSGEFCIYQFIKSYKENKIDNLCLVISLKSINVDEKLIKHLDLYDIESFFPSSIKYKLKNDKETLDLLFKNRLPKSKKTKKNYSDITMEDIKEFIDNFYIELTSTSIVDNSIEEKIKNEINNGIEKISKIPKHILSKDLIETIREYRSEEEYIQISINDIATKWLERIHLLQYVNPVDNELIIDYKQLISRKDDINAILKMFENTNLIHVQGQPGVGKSWFSKEFTDNLDKRNIKNSSYYFYFNSEDGDKEKRLNEYNLVTTFNYNLQKKHGYDINIFNTNISELELEDKDEENYIIFDGIDHIVREASDIDMDGLFKELKTFAEKNKHIKILVLSQPVSCNLIESKYELKNLTIEQTNNLIKRFSEIHKYDTKDLISKKFYEFSGGNPLLLKYMIYDYIYNNNLIQEKIIDLNDYYNKIFQGKEFYVYMYFAVLKFPVTIDELNEISSISITEIQKEIESIRNVLSINDKYEYAIFHESLKRYILGLKKLNKDKLINEVIDWLSKKDLYFNSKKFNYYPTIILENNKTDMFEESFDYNKLKLSIIQNAYSNSEVNRFIKNVYKISQRKKDFCMLYYLEHFYDIYYTFMYDFDINIFENFIFMQYYSGNYESVKNLIYKKEIPLYTNMKQQWEYIRNILIFLLKNDFPLCYEEIINRYFKNSEEDKLIRINKIIVSYDSDNLRLIYEYLKYNKIYDLSKVEHNLEKESNFYIILNNLLKNKKDMFIENFYEKDVIFPKITDIQIDKLIATMQKETYISTNESFIMLINYIFNNSNEVIDEMLSHWDVRFGKVPLVYKFLCLLVNLSLNDEISEDDIKEVFNKFKFNDLKFEGYISRENSDLNFIGKIITKNINYNSLIKEFMIFKNRISLESNNRYHDGIRSLLGTIYNQIIENIKNNGISLNEETLNLLYINNKGQESNISELDYNLTNYILSIISNNPNEEYKNNISNYLFSYGSYRDIQIWELEDILSRMISSEKVNLDKFMKLISIAYNAVERMDRAKDVWHVPNELLKTYSDNVSSIEAINVFFSYLETFNFDIREKDELFSYLYENINKKESKKLKLLYNYWRLINKNIDYQFISDNTELKKCIRNSNKSEYNFIKTNVLYILKDNDTKLDYKKIKQCFNKKKSIINYIEDPSKNYETLEERYTNYVYFDSLKDLLEKVDNSYFDCRTINYENLKDNINKIDTSNEIYELFINIKNSSSLNYIYNILETNNFDYNEYDNDIIVNLLVGLYYRSRGFVSNMSYDEIYEKALNISPTLAHQILEKYIIYDKNIELGRKSGKLFKYLIKEDLLEELYNAIISIYFSRLPNCVNIKRYWELRTFEKSEILLNYFLTKLINNRINYNCSVAEEIFFIKIFELKDAKKIVYLENEDGDSIFHILNYLKMYFNDLRINYNAFLNYKKINKNNKFKFEINSSRTEVVLSESQLVNKELEKLLMPNHRGYVIIQSDDVYKYNANMIQYYGDNILDRNLNYKIFNIYQVNTIKTLYNKLTSRLKLKRNIKKLISIYKKNYYVDFLNIFIITLDK